MSKSIPKQIPKPSKPQPPAPRPGKTQPAEPQPPKGKPLHERNLPEAPKGDPPPFRSNDKIS